MTPEERAKKVERSLEGSPYIADDVERIAAAIREAVEEEREACAKIAEDNRFGWDEYHESNGFSCATAIAAAIRERVSASSIS